MACGEDKESKMLNIISRYFEAQGCRCYKDYFMREGERKYNFDLFCESDSGPVIVEVKVFDFLPSSVVYALIGRMRTSSFDRLKLYLAVPSRTRMLREAELAMQQNGIGLIVVDSDKLDFRIEAKPFITQASVALNEILKSFIEAVNSGLIQSAPIGLNPATIVNAINTSAPYSAKMYSSLRQATLNPYKLRISRELVDKLENIKHLSYASLLTDFKRDYEKVSDPIKESKLILETLQKLWEGKYGKNEAAKLFDSFNKIEPVLKAIPRYRDHFVHPFQVFLMGSLVIDANYSLFHRLHEQKFDKCKKDSLDFAWLVCSTFHDIGYPVQLYEVFSKKFFSDFLQATDSPVLIQTEKLLFSEGNLNYIDNLAGLYNHYKSAKRQWVYNSTYSMDPELRRIRNSIISEAQQRNHGIISSLSLIRKILAEDFVKNDLENYLSGRFSTDIFPAALAMAFHDEHMLSKLGTPLVFEEMPLSFLLVYCDLIQESGRSEEAEIVDLKDFICEPGNTEATLVFSGATEYKKKFDEMERIYDIILSNKTIFSLSLRHAGSNCSRSTPIKQY
jgi:hypothetical protein